MAMIRYTITGALEGVHQYGRHSFERFGISTQFYFLIGTLNFSSVAINDTCYHICDL